MVILYSVSGSSMNYWRIVGMILTGENGSTLRKA
jgi:hypothetical protein